MWFRGIDEIQSNDQSIAENPLVRCILCGYARNGHSLLVDNILLLWERSMLNVLLKDQKIGEEHSMTADREIEDAITSESLSEQARHGES
jgi:hypothetical protein